jgi:hypothetical protein
MTPLFPSLDSFIISSHCATDVTSVMTFDEDAVPFEALLSCDVLDDPNERSTEPTTVDQRLELVGVVEPRCPERRGELQEHKFASLPTWLRSTSRHRLIFKRSKYLKITNITIVCIRVEC